ncbi:hypothetical protein D1AOALGA4SA_2920 [Olavius algarvensis Delta 1 endosymbiont]|nr:hypothetical protein D1AOALGA4SA_2920 [Olavius algarvensis Delta 1 endosymbiont]
MCYSLKSQIQYPIHREPINPATNYVIPAAAERRAGIQRTPRFYWIPAFAHARQLKHWSIEPAHKLKIDQNKLQNCRSNILNLVNVL